MTSKNEIKKLIANGWEITDASCNQMRKEIVKDEIYSFREDRIYNPVTKETKLFEKTLNYNDYTWIELIDACNSFGYSNKQIDKWITEGEEIPLMLECLFELSD
jgi:hypothetical protein